MNLSIWNIPDQRAPVISISGLMVIGFIIIKTIGIFRGMVPGRCLGMAAPMFQAAGKQLQRVIVGNPDIGRDKIII